MDIEEMNRSAREISKMAYIPTKHSKWLPRIFWAIATILVILVVDTIGSAITLYSLMK